MIKIKKELKENEVWEEVTKIEEEIIKEYGKNGIYLLVLWKYDKIDGFYIGKTSEGKYINRHIDHIKDGFWKGYSDATYCDKRISKTEKIDIYLLDFADSKEEVLQKERIFIKSLEKIIPKFTLNYKETSKDCSKNLNLYIENDNAFEKVKKYLYDVLINIISDTKKYYYFGSFDIIKARNCVNTRKKITILEGFELGKKYDNPCFLKYKAEK